MPRWIGNLHSLFLSLAAHVVIVAACAWWAANATASSASASDDAGDWDPVAATRIFRLPLDRLAEPMVEIVGPQEPVAPPPEPLALATAETTPVATSPLPTPVRSPAPVNKEEVFTTPDASLPEAARTDVSAPTPPRSPPAVSPPPEPPAATLTPAPSVTPSEPIATSRPAGEGETPVLRVPPKYPSQARRQGLEGTVRLNVDIDADGRVLTIAVAGSSGHACLDEAARQAVARWHFAAGTAGGRQTTVAIVFRLV